MTETSTEPPTPVTEKRKRTHRGSRRGKTKNKSKSKTKSPKGDQQNSTAKTKSPEKKKQKLVATPNTSSGVDKRAELMDKLNSGRFRYLNEQLYSCTGNEAEQLFTDDKSAFDVYHQGYNAQVAKWPVNPLDSIIKHLNTQPKTLVVADLGCGEGRLSRSVKQKVHSFDLVSTNSNVIACNMSKLPLESQSVDLVVFCLSLMGTNLADYLREANRIMKMNGSLKVAEICSRIGSMRNFLRALEKLGFHLTKKKLIGDMFVMMDFEKTSKPLNKRPPGLVLQPCLYKKR